MVKCWFTIHLRKSGRERRCCEPQECDQFLISQIIFLTVFYSLFQNSRAFDPVDYCAQTLSNCCALKIFGIYLLIDIAFRSLV